MNISIFILEILILMGIGATLLFIKNYFPSYMEEKGKNLATKEDIAEITEKTEEVQRQFREKFELFSSDVRFKYDFYYKQYSELYCDLYKIVIQSEYIRHFLYLDSGRESSFDEAPFIEISQTTRVKEIEKWGTGKETEYQKTVEKFDTPLSKFNKKQLCDYIIENGQYASQQLLKLAVSYRFAYSYYTGNPEIKSASMQDTANDEEFRLIREIVCCIVKEYNILRRKLNMDYSMNEIESGIPEL